LIAIRLAIRGRVEERKETAQAIWGGKKHDPPEGEHRRGGAKERPQGNAPYQEEERNQCPVQDEHPEVRLQSQHYPERTEHHKVRGNAFFEGVDPFPPSY